MRQGTLLDTPFGQLLVRYGRECYPYSHSAGCAYRLAIDVPQGAFPSSNYRYHDGVFSTYATGEKVSIGDTVECKDGHNYKIEYLEGTLVAWHATGMDDSPSEGVSILITNPYMFKKVNT